jgi:[ribosomal protein S18]-alanine N-acetyltransferase
MIRAADIDDMAAVMTVMDAAFDPRFGEAWTAAQLRTLFAVPGTQVGVAGDVALTGFYAARLAGPESELLLLAVHPAARGKGIGRALIDHWLAWAQRHGAADYFLEMRADNPARSLYCRAGFAECGRRPSYYNGSDGVKRDAVTMRLNRD